VKVIVISGPTASGKTELSVELANHFGGEIVNFDSLLFYKEINIGTAKPTPFEMGEVPHHMINIRSISSPMNAADFAKEAFPIVDKLLHNKKIVYLVGGSGFYLQALLKGMYDSPTTPSDILVRSDQLYKEEGIEAFRRILSLNDPNSYERYHANDHYRIRRAVEHFWTTGSALSSAREMKDHSNSTLNNPSIHNWDLLHIYLDITKAEHASIIQKRTEKMLHSGLIEEVQGLLNMGFSGLEKPLQSIGYKEVLNYISGKYKNLSECQEHIVISTRQLAKSQRTWFNRDQSKKKFHPLEERKEIFLQVDDFLKNLKALE
jgi:tRNA dimethylallyltransferase